MLKENINYLIKNGDIQEFSGVLLPIVILTSNCLWDYRLVTLIV